MKELERLQCPCGISVHLFLDTAKAPGFVRVKLQCPSCGTKEQLQIEIQDNSREAMVEAATTGQEMLRAVWVRNHGECLTKKEMDEMLQDAPPPIEDLY